MKKIFDKLTKIGLMWSILPTPPNCPPPDTSPSWACVTIDNILDILRGILRDFIIPLLGAIAVLMFIIGAYSYLTAYGNEEKAEKGKKTIVWAIVGIVVTLLAFAIVTWVWQITAGTAPPPETAPPY